MQRIRSEFFCFKAMNLAKKIRESADYDEPADFDTTKFKNMGNLATGFNPRFVKNMTNVDFGSLLSSGDLKDIDFSKDSVSNMLYLLPYMQI